MTTGAIFLDRDGVLIENRADYVKSWDEVEIFPHTFAAMRKLAQTGRPIIMITNQSAVGRGIITAAFVDEIHRRLLAEVEAHGGRIDAVYFCPHHPQEPCECRKPSPGMLRQAAQERNLDLSASVMVGDAVSDIETAHAVGAKGVLVRTGRGEEQVAVLAADHADWNIPVVADLDAAAGYILTHLSPYYRELSDTRRSASNRATE
jgi:D-glycero-D-manno-heptose 1,7-bisphosphate phosphatase